MATNGSVKRNYRPVTPEEFTKALNALQKSAHDKTGQHDRSPAAVLRDAGFEGGRASRLAARLKGLGLLLKMDRTSYKVKLDVTEVTGAMLNGASKSVRPATEPKSSDVTAVGKSLPTPDPALAYNGDYALEVNLANALAALMVVDQQKLPEDCRGQHGTARLLMHLMGDGSERDLEIPLLMKLLIAINALRVPPHGAYECRKLEKYDVEGALNAMGATVLAEAIGGVSRRYLRAQETTIARMRTELHDLRAELVRKSDELAKANRTIDRLKATIGLFRQEIALNVLMTRIAEEEAADKA